MEPARIEKILRTMMANEITSRNDSEILQDKQAYMDNFEALTEAYSAYRRMNYLKMIEVKK